MTLELFNIIVFCASDALCWTTSYLAWLPELPDILRSMICFFYLTKLQVLLLECHNVIYLFTYRTVSKDKNSNHPLSNLLRVGMIFLSIRQHWSRNNDINWDFLVIGVQLHGSFSAIELFFGQYHQLELIISFLVQILFGCQLAPLALQICISLSHFTSVFI